MDKSEGESCWAGTEDGSSFYLIPELPVRRCATLNELSGCHRKPRLGAPVMLDFAIAKSDARVASAPKCSIVEAAPARCHVRSAEDAEKVLLTNN